MRRVVRREGVVREGVVREGARGVGVARCADKPSLATECDAVIREATTGEATTASVACVRARARRWRLRRSRARVEATTTTTTTTTWVIENLI